MVGYANKLINCYQMSVSCSASKWGVSIALLAMKSSLKKKMVLRREAKKEKENQLLASNPMHSYIPTRTSLCCVGSSWRLSTYTSKLMNSINFVVLMQWILLPNHFVTEKHPRMETMWPFVLWLVQNKDSPKSFLKSFHHLYSCIQLSWKETLLPPSY